MRRTAADRRLGKDNEFTAVEAVLEVRPAPLQSRLTLLAGL